MLATTQADKPERSATVTHNMDKKQNQHCFLSALLAELSCYVNCKYTSKANTY